MDIEAYTVPLHALIALASRHERAITAAWITKYQRLGLLPQDKKPGMGRGRGKPGHYTERLAHQIVPLIQALKLRGKNLGAVGWDLWWFGWHADVRYWRDPLLRQAKIFDEVRSKLTPIGDDDDRPFELLRDVGERLHSTRSKSGVIGAAKRHGSSGATELISLVMGVFMGTYMPFREYAHSTDNHEREESQGLLAKSLTIPISDTDIPKDNSHLPISVEALDGMFSTISGQFSINVSDFISQLSEREIIEARNQIALIMNVIGTVEGQRLTNKQKSIGAKAIYLAHTDKKQQLAYLIGWLVLRRDQQFKNATDQFVKTLKQQIGIPEAS